MLGQLAVLSPYGVDPVTGYGGEVGIDGFAGGVVDEHGVRHGRQHGVQLGRAPTRHAGDLEQHLLAAHLFGDFTRQDEHALHLPPFVAQGYLVHVPEAGFPAGSHPYPLSAHAQRLAAGACLL